MFPDRQNELKITRNVSSQIGLIHLFCCPYYHKTPSYWIFIFVFPSLPGTYKQSISFSSWQLYNPLFWVVLKNPINIILWQHLQHFVKEICS